MRILNRIATPCLALAALFVAIVSAHAASPMFVDDARILNAKACQLETWTRHNRDSTEAWALPACNLTGHFDLTFGGVRLERGRPFYPLGLRYTLAKERLQLDTTFGNRAVSDTAERWFSIGLRFLTPPFLP